MVPRGGIALPRKDESSYRTQLDGAGAPRNRSVIQLSAALALSRAAKVCVTPGSGTKLTRTPWAHKASPKRLVIAGSDRGVGSALRNKHRRAGWRLSGSVA